MISAILNDFISPHPRTSPDEIENEEGCATAPPGLGPRINPDEIENEEDDATPPPEWMDKFVMSEQGSVGLGSNNEDLLDFRGLDDDEGYTGMELDINPDGGMASLVMPDVGMPDLVVGPELVNYPSTKVTQVGVQTVDPGVSMLTGAYRAVRGVL